MTDVNLATRLILDAEDNLFDIALLITADADLTGPIRELRRRHPKKRFLVAFPPRRASSALKKSADGFIRVDRRMLRRSQLSETVTSSDGRFVERPAAWSVG